MDQNDFEGFASYLINELKLGTRTISEYLYVYKNFEPEKISQDYINNFVLKYHNTSIVRAFVKNYLEYHDMKDIFTLPKRAKGRKPVKIVRSIMADEITLLKDYFYKKSFMHGLIFDMLYQGAMRRAEILTIKIGSFFWNEWIMDHNDFCKLIIEGKGKKQRIVLINPETAESILNFYIKMNGLDDIEEIMNFLNENKDQYLFLNKKKKLMNEWDIYMIIKKNSVKAIGRDVRPHELRHARATELEKRGATLRDISRYLGHSRLATTELYLHKSGEESLDSLKLIMKKESSSA